MNTENFLLKMKIKAEAKAREMAALELSIWDRNHEKELKTNFGFTDKQLIERKQELQKTL
jgi:hypothetical protein